MLHKTKIVDLFDKNNTIKNNVTIENEISMILNIMDKQEYTLKNMKVIGYDVPTLRNSQNIVIKRVSKIVMIFQRPNRMEDIQWIKI